MKMKIVMTVHVYDMELVRRDKQCKTVEPTCTCTCKTQAKMQLHLKTIRVETFAYV